ncbi:MAG: TOMM precursor leader peptide-binding protein [Nitrospirales bacterium]
MAMETQNKLRALPTQMIEYGDGVILKRGSSEFRIKGEGSIEAIQLILWMTSTRQPTCQEICEQFPKTQRPIVITLIDQLAERRILVPAGSDDSYPSPESHEEIFYWNFGESQSSASRIFDNQDIVILGVNYISKHILTSFQESGATNTQIVDFPLLRNLRLFDERGQLDFKQWKCGNSLPLEYNKWMEDQTTQHPTCLVATSDFGNHEVIRQWNQFCLKSNSHFLPVILQNTIGYLGPLIIPGETACFECARSRQNSNFDDPHLERATEEKSFEGQTVVGFHPSMPSILGNLAAFELIKFYSGFLPGSNVGTLIEINLLATFLTTRRILKNPRCQACGPFLKRSPLELRKNSIHLQGIKA